jgi:hypothetical protein
MATISIFVTCLFSFKHMTNSTVIGRLPTIAINVSTSRSRTMLTLDQDIYLRRMLYRGLRELLPRCMRSDAKQKCSSVGRFDRGLAAFYILDNHFFELDSRLDKDKLSNHSSSGQVFFIPNHCQTSFPEC